jgi:hypothetical protein
MKSRVLFLCLVFLCSHNLISQENAKLANKVAPAITTGLPLTPPMGWNSWDGYGTTINESQVKANAQWMSEHLKAFGSRQDSRANLLGSRVRMEALRRTAAFSSRKGAAFTLWNETAQIASCLPSFTVSLDRQAFLQMDSGLCSRFIPNLANQTRFTKRKRMAPASTQLWIDRSAVPAGRLTAATSYSPSAIEGGKISGRSP